MGELGISVAAVVVALVVEALVVVLVCRARIEGVWGGEVQGCAGGCSAGVWGCSAGVGG